MLPKAQAVFTYFEADHDRLDTLFANFQHYKNTDYPTAKQYFRDFKFGLQRHIIWEEEILFPIFEKKTGITNGPTAVMRIEHQMIGKRLEELHEKVRQQNPKSDTEEQALMNVLLMHNQKEEAVLYPAIDYTITDEDQENIFRAMKELPVERYENCCQHHGHHSGK